MERVTRKVANRTMVKGTFSQQHIAVENTKIENSSSFKDFVSKNCIDAQARMAMGIQGGSKTAAG